jgi:hypothetical protein
MKRILKKNTKTFLLLAVAVLLLSTMTEIQSAFASALEIKGEIDCEGANKAYASQGIPCYCKDGQIFCNQPSGTHKSKNGISSADINAMIAGNLFESLLTSVFADNTANEQEALAAKQKAAALAAAQAEFDKMMRSYKTLDDSRGVAFKTLADSNLAFKSLDSDPETLAANARKPFDAPSENRGPGSDSISGATPFFGDTMPIDDIKLLVNPENDSRVVDLRKAGEYVIGNIKNDSEKPAALAKKYKQKDNGEPIIQAPDCVKLPQKLEGFINQNNQFQKTVLLAQEQVDTWETANRNSLMNAAKDGLEYFTGQLLEGAARRGEAADRLEEIYQKNAGQMAQEGIDTAAIEAKIRRLKTLSSTGRISELTGNIKDWQDFIKDGVSGLVKQLTASNQEIQAILEDPKMRKYFEMDAPELNTLLDISKIAASNEVLGKWVAKQVPIIGGVELAINQTYNATDWYLSFKRITEANHINGQVLNAARLIQKNIDNTYLALKECPKGGY